MPASTPLASRRREISAGTSGAISQEDGQSLAGRTRAGRPRAGWSVAGRPCRRGFWLASQGCCWPAGVLAGGGAGAAFKGSVTTVLGIARPGARGEALAGLFLAAYVGLAVPVVALGAATQLLSARVAVLGFAVLLVTVVALVSRRLLSSSAQPEAAGA